MSLDDRGRESLASLLDGVAIEHDVAASRLCPDFADAVARACRHAHDRDLAPLVAAARRIDPAGGDQLRRIARIGDLDALVASARATIEQAAAEHRPGTPPVRTTARAPVRAVVLAAIAAVLVAALVVDWRWRGHAVDPAHAGGYSGASKTAEGHPWSEATIDDTPRPTRAAPRSVARAPAVPPIATPAEPPPPQPRTRARASISDTLADADRSARTAWSQGDLPAAEAAFEAIVAKGGRRPLVELAFGDLFELARQRGDATKQTRLWQRYLRRFPSGRYADEAGAGLCRHASGAEARACWQRYLDERPHGIYRDRARAALGTGMSPREP